VISGLIASFSTNVSANPQISAAVKEQVSVRLEGNVSFVTADQVRAGAEAAGVDPGTTDVLVDHYVDSQLVALKTGLLVAALLSLVAFLSSGSLPTRARPATPEASDSELVPA
jgi:hypothetical protein